MGKKMARYDHNSDLEDQRFFMVETGTSVKPLKCSECTIGLRVALVNPDPEYSIGYENPAYGTKFYCEGEVRDCDHQNINVVWDNESSNTYKDFELAMTGDKGRFISIWDI